MNDYLYKYNYKNKILFISILNDSDIHLILLKLTIRILYLSGRAHF